MRDRGDRVAEDVLFPSNFREVEARPFLRRVLAEQVDMHMADLRVLLAMPIPSCGFDGGCNLTATALLCSVVSGASTLFFEASLESVRSGARRDSGERFKEVMKLYYPWQ